MLNDNSIERKKGNPVTKIRQTKSPKDNNNINNKERKLGIPKTKEL